MSAPRHDTPLDEPQPAPRNLVMEEMGHAYGSAKFPTQDLVFGDRILQGEAIRKVTVTYLDRGTRTGYIANRTMAMFAFRGMEPVYPSAYLGNPADLIASLPGGTSLYTLERGQKDPTYQGTLQATTRYTASGFVDAGLQWVKGYTSTRSSKAVASTLRRSRKVIGFALTDVAGAAALPAGIDAPAAR